MTFDGWATKPLSEVCENLDSKRKPITKSKRVAGPIPYYGASGIVDHVEGYLFDEELLLVSEDGANLLARTYPIAFSVSGKTWVNNHAHVLRFPNNCARRFIEYYLNSISLEPWVSGMAQPKLNQTKLNSIPVPNPPLEEQKRIVSILDEAFSAIAKAKENAEKNLLSARELFESYLNRVFTQQGPDWQEKPLGEVVTLQGGSQPPKSTFVYEPKADYIRLIQIRDYKSDKKITFIPEEKARRKCNSTDIMIGRYGPPLFQILRGINGAYNVALMKATPNEGLISKDYLYYFLKNRDLLNHIEASSSRTAGQTGFKKETLETYPLCYPESPTAQARIVSLLEEAQTASSRLETIYTQKLANLDELKQSLLQKAFTGQLTNRSSQLEATC